MGSFLRALCLMAAACGCGAQDLRISASVGPLENVLRPVETLLMEREGVRLVLKQASPAEALKDLEEGRADAAAAAMELETWLQFAGRPVTDAAHFKVHSLGKDVVQLITHPDLPIVALRMEEVLGIFSGRIRNWKELEGPDLAISWIACGDMLEITRMMTARLAPEEAGIQAGQIAKNLPELRAVTAKTPGAAAFGPRAANRVEVNAPIIPEISLPMVLITKGDPSKSVRLLLKLIASKQGRKLVMN